jgi:hypothetical protein
MHSLICFTHSKQLFTGNKIHHTTLFSNNRGSDAQDDAQKVLLQNVRVYILADFLSIVKYYI